MSGIVWEEPREKRQGENGRRWAEFVSALKEKPGSWARVDEYRYHPASTVRRLKSYGCETTTRTREYVTILYARWPE